MERGWERPSAGPLARLVVAGAAPARRGLLVPPPAASTTSLPGAWTLQWALGRTLGTGHPPEFGATARGHCGASFPSPSARGPPHHFPRPASYCVLRRLPTSLTPPFASSDRHAGGRTVPASGVGSGVRLARAPCHLPDLHPLHAHAPRPTIPAVVLRNSCAHTSVALVSGAERGHHLPAPPPARPSVVHHFFVFFHG